MRPERYRAETLTQLLRHRTIVTMADLKQALGTDVEMTIFRKLHKIDYLTSYSHKGRFYLLADRARFDERGLFSVRDVHFSRFGSLLNTVEQFVRRSDQGYFAGELQEELDVVVKDALRKLTRLKRLSREEVSRLYLYCSAEPTRRRQQLVARRVLSAEGPFGRLGPYGAQPSDEHRAAMILFLSALDEKRRRLFAGLESLRLGMGGDRRIAEWTGLDVHTVAKGRKELLSRKLGLERIRREGGGRKPAEKKRRI